MTETQRSHIETLLQKQRAFYSAHQTRALSFRLENLRKFKAAIHSWTGRISDALKKDLNKSFEEAYLTEISIVLREIDTHIKNLKCWTKPHRVPTPLSLQPSSSRIMYEPLGVALIMAPWNYPLQLLLNPLVGAISAGCCAVLKPSPYTATVARVMEEMIGETFPDHYISMVQGGRNVNAMLLEQRWDMIFFSGSTQVGKVVMKAAAEFLTPVVLELGGKSPCIVDKQANLDIAARRIAWGKSINAGQSCIGPDYLFAHASVKDELIQKIDKNFKRMYGEDIRKSEHFPRIVNHQAFDRIKNLMEHGTIKSGGVTDRNDRYISPTIIDDVDKDYPIMQEEIFGPVLPVMSFENIGEVVSYINSNEKPLALYYFGKNRHAKDVLGQTTSGGVCINDTLLHIANNHLPFGGVGSSGIGKYHGRESFLAFSNRRSVVSSRTWIDLPMKYAPFKNFGLIKRLL